MDERKHIKLKKWQAALVLLGSGFVFGRVLYQILDKFGIAL